ncbi:MAG: glycosyltransferase [Bacteroidota bacterium]|nr:glycosyltransferase [Bacteroidota bacterium]
MKHQFIKGRDIVMFSFQSWDSDIGSNFKDMALELARNNRILFINRALDRKSLWSRRKDPVTQSRLDSIKTGKGELELVAPNIWVHNPRILMESINSIPFAGLHDWLNKWNGKRLAAEINKAIVRTGFRDTLLINDNDFIRGFYLKDYIPCTEYIFYIRDYMIAVDFFKKHGPRLERGLMVRADLVVANSEYLAGYARKVNPQSFYIGQGCDFSPFVRENYPVPDDLQTIPHPIIGYTGFVSAWRIDTAILEHIATSLPACQLVLVGPVDWMFKKEALERLPNVHFLGGKPPAALAGYINQFDICINPQIVNDITRGNYPRKADEYLAMGKPLVATRTEGMKMFEACCFLCDNKEEYVEKIQCILDDTQNQNNDTIKEARREFALSHTWEESIGMLGDAYHAFVQRKTS